MAHEHADRLTVYFDDAREPRSFEDVSYTLYREGVVVYVDGDAEDFPLARAVADKLAAADA
ncbi:hypothetical protein ACIA5D_36685 [Actinoplanes sp. NPDC051513]|uniref:hypothetical protein n=1 Tax=Actinoplanes sp. NPDC051513 TaxID=3363908 RepID=UPI00379622A0